jgi:membrane protease YdiL (CAAX protease family)
MTNSRWYDPPEWEGAPDAAGSNRPAPPVEEDIIIPPPTPPFEPSLDEVTLPPLRTARRGRRRDIDPLFIYVVIIALSVGLTPLAATAPHDRYAILWSAQILAGAVSAWLGREPRLTRPQSNDLLWGAVFGFLVGGPLLLVGPPTLSRASDRIFSGLPNGVIFQTLVFVMSVAETLFFRGMIQAAQSVGTTTLLASIWSVLLFFPAMNINLREQPVIPLTVGILIVMLNLLYSYVRQRNGLSAAWVCQVVASLCWLLIPRLFP